MIYKGYIAHLKFDEVKSIFYGQVANTHNLTFCGKSLEETREAFQNAIDKRFEKCVEQGN